MSQDEQPNYACDPAEWNFRDEDADYSMNHKHYMRGRCVHCNEMICHCTCPKVLRVTSGSHAINVRWHLGGFTAVSADEASTVSESQAAYMRDWPLHIYGD